MFLPCVNKIFTNTSADSHVSGHVNKESVCGYVEKAHSYIQNIYLHIDILWVLDLWGIYWKSFNGTLEVERFAEILKFKIFIKMWICLMLVTLKFYRIISARKTKEKDKYGTSSNIISGDRLDFQHMSKTWDVYIKILLTVEATRLE